MAFKSRGLPSTGCNKCRSRKIRCDEKKPICENCQRKGHTECKYRNEFERTWRDQTDKTVESHREWVHPKNANVKPSNLEPEVMDRFLHDWAIGTGRTPGISISWFEALPSIYQEAKPNGLLRKSFEAVANANHGQRCHRPKSLEKAAVLYGDALRKMRETLVSGLDVPTRDVLASVILLGIYEALVDKSASPNGTWMSHAKGASMLLSMQSQMMARSQAPVDLQISRMISRQMLHASLLWGRKPPPPEQQPQKTQVPDIKHINEHSRLVQEAGVLFSEWRVAFKNVDTAQGLQNLSDMASRALSLDHEFALWPRDLPRMCAYTQEPIPDEQFPDWLEPLLSDPGAPRSLHVYVSPVAEMLWRFHWVASTVLCQALLYTNSVLKQRNSPSNPVAAYQGEIEASLLGFLDRQCESCVGSLIGISKKVPQGLKAEDIPSLYGYLMLQVVLFVGLCLDQVVMDGVDLTSRAGWLKKLKEFVQLRLGVSKAALELEPERRAKLPIQFWSMTD